MCKEVDNGEGCVFSDLNDRLAPKAKAWLDAATPEKPSKHNAQNVARAREAYEQMERWLAENRSWAFAGASQCLIHNKACPSHPGDAPTDDVAESGPPRKKPARSANALPSPRPLYVSCAGVTCVALSTVGSRLNRADAFERAHMIWATERKLFAEQLKEDVFFGECVPNYPVQEKLKLLESSHLLLHIVTGPEYLGWPTKRSRCFFAGLNLRTVTWLGEENYAKVFMDKYYRMTMMTGDALLIAPDEMMWSYHSHLASRRQNHMDPVAMKAMDRSELLSLLVSPSQFKAFAEYKELEADYMSPGGPSWQTWSGGRRRRRRLGRNSRRNLRTVALSLSAANMEVHGSRWGLSTSLRRVFIYSAAM